VRRPAFLLHGALAYALDVVGALPADLLDRPTPCPGWDVAVVLRHLAAGLAVLGGERARDGAVGWPVGPIGARLDDPVRALVGAACELLTRPLTSSADLDAPAASGAIEVAVHTWDVTRACGAPRPVPALIAADLLVLAPLLVPAALRPRHFAAPVRVAPGAVTGDRLVAFLGRHPDPPRGR
jgi:uncharacterized protein (TIGR03086 family)